MEEFFEEKVVEEGAGVKSLWGGAMSPVVREAMEKAREHLREREADDS